MRFPVETIWAIVGSVYAAVIRDDDRRPFEALWQGMSDLAADAARLLKFSSTQDVPNLTDWLLPWGKQVALPASNTDRQIKLTLLGGYVLNSRWVWGAYSTVKVQLALPMKLRTPRGDTLIVQVDQVELLAGGWLIVLTTTDLTTGQAQASTTPVGIGSIFGPSTDFSGNARYRSVGSAAVTQSVDSAVFRSAGMNWSILADSLSLDGTQNWSVRSVWRITKWDVGTLSRGHIGQSFWGGSDGWISRLEQVPAGLRVSVGRDQASSTLWPLPDDDVLRSATLANPIQVEIISSWNARSRRLGTFVYVDGQPVTPAHGDVELDTSQRSMVFDVFCELGEIEAQLLAVVQTAGRTNTGETTENAFLGPLLAFQYTIEQPLLSCQTICHEPWRLAPPAIVTSYSSNQVIFELDEDWAGYAPLYARVGDLMLTRVALGADSVTYDVQGWSVGVGLMVRLEPFFLRRDEVSWTQPGSFSTDRQLPPGEMWFLESEGTGVDLSGRFGDMLRLPKRDDSPDYLSLVRGSWRGVHAPASQYHITQALSLMLGVPIVMRDARVESYTIKTDPRSQQLVSQATLSSGELVSVPFQWTSLTPAVGSPARGGDALFDGVLVYDVIKNRVRAEANIPAWQLWTTFVVEVSSTIGLSVELITDMRQLLDRSKDTHHRYIIKNAPSNEVEEIGGPNGSLTHSQLVMSYAHALEDMVIPIGESVVGNDIEPITAPTALLMGAAGGLTEGNSLGGPRWAQDSWRKRTGLTLGLTYPRQELLATDVFERGEPVDLFRPVDVGSAEFAAGFRRGDARMLSAGMPHPTVIHRVLDASSNIITPYTLGWIPNLDPPAGTVDIWMDAWGDILAATQTEVFRSVNYSSFTSTTTPSATGQVISQIVPGWVVGSDNLLWQRTGVTTWVDASRASEADVDWTRASSAGTHVSLIGVDAISGDHVLMTSVNNGSSWVKFSTSTSEFYDVAVSNSGNIWVVGQETSTPQWFASFAKAGLSMPEDFTLPDRPKFATIKGGKLWLVVNSVGSSDKIWHVGQVESGEMPSQISSLPGTTLVADLSVDNQGLVHILDHDSTEHVLLPNGAYQTHMASSSSNSGAGRIDVAQSYQRVAAGGNLSSRWR